MPLCVPKDASALLVIRILCIGSMKLYAYLVNVVNYSDTLDDRHAHMRQIPAVLRNAVCPIDIDKYGFICKEQSVISTHGIWLDPVEIKAAAD